MKNHKTRWWTWLLVVVFAALVAATPTVKHADATFPPVTGEGLTLYQAADATPSLTTSYATSPAGDHSADPWAGGTLNLTYTNTTDWRFDHKNYPNQLLLHGLTFAVYLELPANLTADAFLAARVPGSTQLAFDFPGGESSSGSYGGTYSGELPDSAMTAVNDRVIQVTVTNDNSTNYLSAMLVFFSVMLQHDVDVSQVPMRLTTQVDIAQATANGAPDDSTSNRAPTTGKLPPAASGKLDFRAALYGLDEEAPPAAVASTTPTWSQYLSPWDTTGVANTIVDEGETIDGNAANLPGVTGARTVALSASEPFDPARFIRVVDYAKRTSADTSGVHYTDAADPSLSEAAVKAADIPAGGRKTVLYYGTVGGQPLSPVPLTITRSTVDPPTITGQHAIQNVSTSADPGTAITATAGNVIESTTTFRLTTLAAQTSLSNTQVRLSLPANVTFVPNSLTINGEPDATAVTAAGVDRPLGHILSAAGDHVTITYRYTIAPEASGELSVPGAALTSTVTYPSTVTPPDGPLMVTANPATINIAAGAPQLTKVPTQIDFGDHSYAKLPKTFTGQPNDPQVLVSDPQGSQWQLMAATNATGLAIGAHGLSATPQHLYSHDGRAGTIDVNANAALGPFTWRLTRPDVTATTTATITWSIVVGP
ncbi:hypothetical protein [Lacticaseibacillus nasuensis]|uniref:hypothetical protein n=1 Tax=Lacticaseibacillus nasuensis TaxID=944671 RepID=UPI0007049406|nr:hypothetical protein [Lacticaseibacillus nasuensis]